MSRTNPFSPHPDGSSTRASLKVAVATAYPGRAGWSGCLRFRLVAVSVRGYPMLRSPERVELHLIHRGCGQRIRLQKYCPTHGPVEAQEVAKGHQHALNQWVTIDPCDMGGPQHEADKIVLLDRVLEPAQVDPALYSGRSLCLLPNGPTAWRPYAVMCAALRHIRKWALGRARLAGRRGAILVRPLGNGLVLDVLHDPSLLSGGPDESSCSVVDVSDEELALAGRLLNAFDQPFQWNDYHDDTPARLSAVIEAKMQGRDPPAQTPESVEEPGLTLGLEAALRQSLAMSQMPRSQRRPTTPRPSGSKSRRRTT